MLREVSACAEDWADKPTQDFNTVASFQLPSSPDRNTNMSYREAMASSRSGSVEFPPFIRRSEENLQLIVGGKPGEFELHAPEGRRFSFSTADNEFFEQQLGLAQGFVSPALSWL